MVPKVIKVGKNKWDLARALFPMTQFVLGVAYFISIIRQDIWRLLSRDTAHANDAKKLNHLDIEPSNICNANCVFCAYQYQDGKSYRQIDRQLAERLLDSFCSAGGGDVGLTPVVGDPLIAPNIEELVALCRSRKEIKRIGMTTNGILLSPERFSALRGAGLTDLIISMTYPDENEYETVFRSKRYRQLIHNLEALLSMDKGGVTVTLALRTPRIFLRHHPLLTQARKAGWEISKNAFFDDWSSSVNEVLNEHHLMKRPLRGQYLPCTMLHRARTCWPQVD